MTRQSDIFMLVLLVIALSGWLYWRFKRWLYAPTRIRLPYDEPSAIPRNEAVRLLEEAGYKVISGKKRIPLIIEMDDEVLDSRLFVDLFARKDHELYVVRFARERQLIQWTASGIRDKLMIYAYLFKEVHGVLYVDVQEKLVRKIKIDVGEAE